MIKINKKLSIILNFEYLYFYQKKFITTRLKILTMKNKSELIWTYNQNKITVIHINRKYINKKKNRIIY